MMCRLGLPTVFLSLSVVFFGCAATVDGSADDLLSDDAPSASGAPAGGSLDANGRPVGVAAPAGDTSVSTQQAIQTGADSPNRPGPIPWKGARPSQPHPDSPHDRP